MNLKTVEEQTKECQNCRKEFVIEPEDFVFYEKMKVPAPNLCPDCRKKRRLAWRNERTFYQRKCDLCRKEIIAIYHPRYPAPVYCFGCYHSDKWSGNDYAADYSPNKPFFEQFAELIQRVPKAALHIGTTGQININSPYVNFAGGNKNCYLLFNSTANENSAYCRGIINSKDSFDIYFGDRLELCYEGININNSNKVFWSQNVYNSLDSYFLLNCADVQNCFGCVNLRHKSCYFFNQPLEKNEWEKRVKEILGSYKNIEKIKKEFAEFSLKFPYRENNNLKSINCSGDYIYESKNCRNCLEMFKCENCRYGFSVKLNKDSYDLIGRGANSELLLETVATGHGCFRILGSWSVEASSEIEYSSDLTNCHYCFGCVGLKNAEYCILNKRYSKEEYQTIKEKIITELKSKNLYGLYLPPELSPWAYNETLSLEMYPLTKEAAAKEGFRWEDEIPRTAGKETIDAKDIPDNIKDALDNIVDEILKCEKCGYNYRLINKELEFYRKMSIPIPRICFNCRHLERVEKRGPFRLFDRICAKCGKNIKTSYAPDRPEIVYCEECYKREIN